MRAAFLTLLLAGGGVALGCGSMAGDAEGTGGKVPVDNSSRGGSGGNPVSGAGGGASPASATGGQTGQAGGAQTGPSVGSGGSAVSPGPATGSCKPGEQRACSCSLESGMNANGTSTCAADGVWTQCGCPFEHPYPGPTCSNGAVRCGLLSDENTMAAAQHCCTSEGKCGLMNNDGFGSMCVPRGVEPPGKETTECGETVLPFLEVEDCCRPDGQCGLWFRPGPGWEDLGCVERVKMAGMLKKAGTFASFLAGSALDAIKPGKCTYK